MPRTPLLERPRLLSERGPAALPRPSADYDPRDQAEFRRLVESKLGAIGGNVGVPLPGIVNAMDHGVTMNGTTDDTTALQAILDALKADGGGTLYLGKGTLKLSGTVTVDRTVSLWGAGTQQTKVTSDGTERAIQIVGADSKWSHAIRDIHFNDVRIEYGPTTNDYGGKGAIIQDCEISNCTKAIKYTYHCFLTCIDRCRIYNDSYTASTYGVYFDFDTANSGSGASMKISNSDIFNFEWGVFVNGNTTDGHDIVISATDIEHCATALKVAYVDSTLEGTIHLIGCHLELNTAALIHAEGSHVFLDNFWALSGSESYSFIADNSDGTPATIHISNGRLTWGTKFAKMLGGRIYYDQPTIVGAGLLFGEGTSVMTDGNSTSGDILLPRATVTGRFADTYTLTNASPQQTAEVVQAYDGNKYSWEFDWESTTAGATDNVLRVYVNPGGTVTVNVALPVADGLGHARCDYVPSGALSINAQYITNAGAASAYYATSADTNGKTVQRTFDIKSDKAGATAAQIVIRNLVELIHGYKQTGI